MSTISASTTSTTAYKVTADTTGTLVLQTGSTPTTAATIGTTGNIGVGIVDNANIRLQVKQAVDSNVGGIGLTSVDGTVTSVISALNAGAMTFRNAGAEAMRIDSSNNVGIGTSSPAQKLDVNGRIICTGGGYTTNPNGAIFGYYASGSYPVAYIQAPASGGIDFWNAGTGAVGKFDTNGTFTVSGSYSNNYAAIFSNTSTTTGSVAINGNAGTNSSATFIFYGTAASGQRFSAYGNGGLANYSANNVNLSDRREKTNFAPAKNYLDVVCAIPVQTFNYIDQDLENDGGLTLGVVAQDVQEVAPELVSETNWGTQDEPKMRLSIYQTDLQYALMKCIQELKAELDAAKADIATLKGAA